MKFWISLAVAAELVLLLGDFRVLVWQQHNYVPNGQDSLTCNYFTGRGVVAGDVWYSPNNIFGRDSCTFIKRSVP